MSDILEKWKISLDAVHRNTGLSRRYDYSYTILVLAYVIE